MAEVSEGLGDAMEVWIDNQGSIHRGKGLQVGVLALQGRLWNMFNACKDSNRYYPGETPAIV